MSHTKLIWITPGAEPLIAYIARVSSENQSNPEYKKLIKYLIRNRHFSPFEMVNVCFEIKTSRAISAQIIRHRSFSFQEFSQRYANVIDVEPIEIRKQATSNRQSSKEVFDPILDIRNAEICASELINQLIEDIQWTYDKLIKLGVAKECARMIMPIASSTTIYMNGTLRSWIHYLQLRTDEHTQKEHRLIAEDIELVLRLHFPTVWEALDELKYEQQDKDYLYSLLGQAEVPIDDDTVIQINKYLSEKRLDRAA